MYSTIFYSLLLMIMCTTQGCVTENEPEGASLQVGEALPYFSVTLNDGTTVSNATITGKVPMIVFFNTGCGDCQRELPQIQKVWDEFKDNPDVVIALIAREETEEEIQAYWTQAGFTMPYSAQAGREVYNLFAQSIIPRIYIADKKGIVTASYSDVEMPDASQIAAQITKNL